MRFEPLGIADAVRVVSEPADDERGSFVRLHCEREFAQHGLAARIVQTSLSTSRRRGTVRGLHFQWPPSNEAKLVRCIRGAVYDVLVDLRPDSPTYTRHASVELSDDNHLALYIPSGCAHGFQALTDDAHVLYQMTDHYQPSLAGGVRWNDAAFGIAWPLPATVLHPRDAAYADFDAAAFAGTLRARRRAGG